MSEDHIALTTQEVAPHEDDYPQALDWRIYAPRLRRLEVWINNEDYAKADGEPRLWLMNGDYDDKPPGDVLHVAIPSDMFFGKTWPAWTHPLPRLGTQARYRNSLRWLNALIALLGWTLTADEQALVDALEAYAEGMPQRRRAA